MTVNEQLRGASQRIQDATRMIRVADPPSRTTRLRPVGVSMGLIAVLSIVALVLVNPLGGDRIPTFRAPTPADDTGMVREWIDGALAGRFEDISGLAYGEHSEPEALAALAEVIHGYSLQYGEPDTNVNAFETDSSDLAFTCVTLDFGDVRIEGGMVVREWPDLGRRLWEFRTGMTGCAAESESTTTLPDSGG